MDGTEISHNPSQLLKMSRAAKITFAGTMSMAIGIVIFVHYGQQAEQAVRIIYTS